MLLSRFPTAITASLIGLGGCWQRNLAGLEFAAEPELQPLMVEGQQANPAISALKSSKNCGGALECMARSRLWLNCSPQGLSVAAAKAQHARAN